MPVPTRGLFLLLLAAVLFCSAAGCIQTPATADAAASAFYVPDKTEQINPADLRSDAAIERYGAPILLPDTDDYTIQTFGDLFSDRPQIYPLVFTVYGERYCVNLSRANWDMVDDGIDSYTASLDASDYQSHIIITVTQNNEILASFPYKNHRIYVEPLYLPAENGLPLHIVYQDTYPELPKLPVLNSSDAIFTVTGHTTVVPRETLNTSAFLEKYGPIHISPSIAKFDVVFFRDPIPPLGDPVLEIPVTIRGNPYTVTMQRVESADNGASTPLHEYVGRLTGADSKIFLTQYPSGIMYIGGRLNSDSATTFGVNFQNGTLLHGSVAVPGERIVITPLQTGANFANTTNPPYLVYSRLDVLPAEFVDEVQVPAGELRLIQVYPIDFVGESPIRLTEERLAAYPALRSMIWGIHPPMKAGVTGVADPQNYTVMVTPEEADLLLAEFGSDQYLIWDTGTYFLRRG